MAHEDPQLPLPEVDADRYRLIQTALGLTKVIYDNYPPLINSEQPVPYSAEEIDGVETVVIRHPYHPLVEARIDRKLNDADFLVVHQNILIDIHGEAYYRELLHSEDDMQQLIAQYRPGSTFDIFSLPIDAFGGDGSAEEMGLRRMGVDDLEDTLDNLYRIQQNYRQISQP